MPTLREAVSDAARSFFCAASSATNPFQEWLAGATSSVPGVGQYNRFADDFSDSVRGLVCPQPAPTGAVNYPVPAPTPGQCDGVVYRGIFEYERDDGLVQQGGIPEIFGPVGDVVITLNPPGSNIGIRCRGRASQPIQPPGTVVGLLGSSGETYVRAEVVSLFRPDGQPDDCGDTPPQQPPTGSDEITYDGPDGVVVVDAPITIIPVFPIVGPGGVVVIPVEVCLSAFCLNLELNITTGDIVFNFGGQPESDNCCPPTSDDDPPPENDDDPPPPDQDVRYWGVKTICSFSLPAIDADEIGDGQGPNLYIPRLGVVRFAVEVGGGRAWTIDQPIKTVSQFTPVNAPAAAYAFTVLAEPGVTIEEYGVPVEV